MPKGIPISHHIRALPPALKAMQAMGYDPQECLAGTGIQADDLLSSEPQLDFTLDQEFRFHRNLLRVSGDPLLGLTLGQAYQPQSYGLFGYAFLSAPNLRQAMAVVSNFGPLSFTLFRIDFREQSGRGRLTFHRHVDIPEDLLPYYVDRDLAACLAGVEPGIATPITPLSVAIMHDGQGQQQAYEEVCGCPVSFDAPHTQVVIDASVLDTPMSMQDAETSAICQQQCQLLLARMSKSSSLIERVRQQIIARPGVFPDIESVAERLNTTVRTLRRKLDAENSSFQHILSDVRYQLAREYLSDSQLPIEEIAALLGYSSPGNFSQAFKRWHGASPRAYRQEVN